MRILRFSHRGDIRYGVVEDATDGPRVVVLQGHPFGELRPTGERLAIPELRLLPPILPTKVIGVGRNYAGPHREAGAPPPGAPALYLKPSTAVIGPGERIAHPKQSQRVDYEAELAVVIGRLCREVPRRRAQEVIYGYTCGNDVTARDLQASDGQPTRAKGFDTFCPLGPWIETDLDPTDLAVTARLNGETVQSARTSRLLHDVPALVEHVSAVMTLIPGDVILTGTPEGAGPMRAGDEISVSIEGIGTLTNRVIARE